MSAPTWIEQKIAAWERLGLSLAYLGSMPSNRNIPTQGEIEREDFLSISARKLGLMLTIDHRGDRRYFFVESANAFDHRADVSNLVFGELESADSAGFVCTLSPELGSASMDGAVPIYAINGPVKISLSRPGTLYGSCVEQCDHEHCAWVRAIADANCYVCKQPIGYGVVCYAFTLIGSERVPQSYVHESCTEGDYDALRARVMTVFGQKKTEPPPIATPATEAVA